MTMSTQYEMEAILASDPPRRDLIAKLRANGQHQMAALEEMWAWQHHHARPGKYGPGSKTFPAPPRELEAAVERAQSAAPASMNSDTESPSTERRTSRKAKRGPNAADTMTIAEAHPTADTKPIEYAKLMEPVARRLLGDPNPALSRNGGLRFGTNGSLAVDSEKGQWFSHEDNTGGGVLDLVRRELQRQRDDDPNAASIEPHDWLRREGFIEDGALLGAKLGPIVATYDYRDEKGDLLFQVCRFDQPRKSFRQRRPATQDDLAKGTKSEWVWKTADVRKVLYRLPDLLKRVDDPVFVVEGEKDADRLWSLDLVATCNPGGATKSDDKPKWTPDLNPPLAGRTVYIVPDNDDVGRAHAHAVAGQLVNIAKDVRIVSLPGLDTKGDVSDWLDAGNNAASLIEICCSTPIYERPKPQGLPLHFHGDGSAPSSRWLIRHLLPETGVAILSGQWGTFKSFQALDIAASVMTGVAPRDGQPVYRKSGVLFIAAEGSSDLPLRLAALNEEKIAPLGQKGTGQERHDSGNLPFCWVASSPLLLDKKAVNPNTLETLVATARAAEARLKSVHDLPLGLIVIDTMAAVAGWTDENDNAQAALVMDALRRLSDTVGALVLVVDHFGKEEQTGTRGASAKEAAADAVLAILGEKKVDGSVTNTRLAIRKQRGGPSGDVFHFDARVVEMGVDEHGFPLTSRVIEWVSGPKVVGKPNLSPLQRVMMEAFSASSGAYGRPMRIHGRELTVVPEDAVKKEFLTRYASGKRESKLTLFWRALRELRAKDLLMKGEFDGEKVIYDPETIPF